MKIIVVGIAIMCHKDQEKIKVLNFALRNTKTINKVILITTCK